MLLEWVVMCRSLSEMFSASLEREDLVQTEPKLLVFLCRGTKYSTVCRNEGKRALLLLGQEQLFVAGISWMGNLRDTARY